MWVEVDSLDKAPQALYGADRVAIHSCVHCWDAQVLQDLQCGGRLVVRSVVDDDDRVVSPVGPLRVQFQSELLEESGHHPAVRVGLGEGQVDGPSGVDPADN